MLIFGSFTEDEIKLFQSQSAQKSRGPSSEKAGCQPRSEKLAFQFGSLDITSLNSVQGFGAGPKQTTTTVRRKDAISPNLAAKDPALRNGKSSECLTDSQKVSKAQANGILNGCPSISGVCDDKTNNLDLNSMHTCENRPDNAATPGLDKKHITGPTVVGDCGFQGSKNNNSDKHCGTSTVAKSALDDPKKLSEQALPAKNILPRGLINLGNLCFLNATLQALLSCLPFVQLLQDLANRGIPKVLVISSSIQMCLLSSIIS